MTSGILSSYNGQLRNPKYAWQDNTDALEVRQETEVHILVERVILGFVFIFKKIKAS